MVLEDNAEVLAQLEWRRRTDNWRRSFVNVHLQDGQSRQAQSVLRKMELLLFAHSVFNYNYKPVIGWVNYSVCIIKLSLLLISPSVCVCVCVRKM